MILRTARSTSLPSVEIIFAALDDDAIEEGALAEDGFEEMVASEDRIVSVLLALPLLKDELTAGAPARHSALMMAMVSHPLVLEYPAGRHTNSTNTLLQAPLQKSCGSPTTPKRS